MYIFWKLNNEIILVQQANFPFYIPNIFILNMRINISNINCIQFSNIISVWANPGLTYGFILIRGERVESIVEKIETSWIEWVQSCVRVLYLRPNRIEAICCQRIYFPLQKRQKLWKNWIVRPNLEIAEAQQTCKPLPAEILACWAIFF